MIAVLTGDIIGSRAQRDASKWLIPLKEALGHLGQSPKDWEIFQGDSFQLETAPENGLLHAMYLKACMRSLGDLDIRIAIGLGEKTHVASTITEANGSAFLHSGETLKQLKRIKQNLVIKSHHARFDETLNLMLKLALMNMDNWTTGAAEIMKMSLLHPAKNQKQLGSTLGITQSSVSQRQKTAHFSEMMALNVFYQKYLQEISAS
jgi:hypothetical protein